jgi:hypothetical protein
MSHPSNHLRRPNPLDDTVAVTIRGDWILLCKLTNEMNPNHPIWRVGAVSPDIYLVDLVQSFDIPQVKLHATCPYGIAEEAWREISQKYPTLHIQCIRQTSDNQGESHLFIGGKVLVEHADIVRADDRFSSEHLDNEALIDTKHMDPSNTSQALMMRRPVDNWINASLEVAETWAVPAPPWLPLPNQTTKSAMIDFIDILGSLIQSKDIDDVDKLCAARRIIDVTYALFSLGTAHAVDWLAVCIPSLLHPSSSHFFSAALANSHTPAAEFFALACTKSGQSLSTLFSIVQLAYIAQKRPANFSIILASTTWGYSPSEIESSLAYCDEIDPLLLAQIQHAAISQEFNANSPSHEERDSKRL